jgi:soluble lytic murein transglycosylase-like protein
MSEKNVFRREAARQAERFGIDPELYVRLIERESGFDPNAKGSSGEIGLAQIMPDTAKDPGYGTDPISDRSDPMESLRFGAQHLANLIENYDGDVTLALQAYNGGGGNVARGTVSDDARKYASELLNGKELKATRPQARPSGLVPQAEDKAGQAAIEKALRDLFAEDPAPKIDGAPTPGGFRASSKMSPLSRRGLPGAGSIDRYSTPGGIESLYRGSR